MFELNNNNGIESGTIKSHTVSYTGELVGITLKFDKSIAPTSAIIAPEIVLAHLYHCSRNKLIVAQTIIIAHNIHVSSLAISAPNTMNIPPLK